MEVEGTFCFRNMDVIKMIHVKGQAAAPGWDTPSVALWTFHFPQEIGKIHAMGKSKYSWPKPLAAAAVAAMSLPQLQAKGRETSS